MNAGKEQDLKDLQIIFVGKILAGFTHEIKNHLSIIKESAGLMQDLIELGKSPVKKDAHPYLSSIQLINEQVGRSIDALRYLNRFSHRMDVPLSTFSMNEIMEELVALISRFANQKKITLEKDFQKQIPLITSNPSKIQLLVYSLIEEIFKRLEPNGRIVIKTSHSDESILIHLIRNGLSRDESHERAFLSQDLLHDTLKELNGTLSQKERDSEAVIRLPLSVQTA